MLLLFGSISIILFVLWIIFGALALMTNNELCLDLSIMFVILGLLSLIITGSYT